MSFGAKTNEKKKKARELELARRFQEIIEAIPLVAVNNLIRDVIVAFETSAPEQNLDSLPLTWSTVPDISHHRKGAPAIAVEVWDNAKKNRFDLVVPVPLFTLLGRSISSLIFEFKLGGRDIAQLDEYARTARNSLVVSISVGVPGSPERAVQISKSFEAHAEQSVWLHQTWEQLYWALQSMLSGDALPRVEQVDEPDERVLNFDWRLPGQDRLSFAVESFLQLVLSRGLLPNHRLVLVVPIGKHAAQTLVNPGGAYYAHPANWRAGYQYLVAVKSNRIEKVYRVIESWRTQDSSGDDPPLGISAAAWEELQASDLRLSSLDEIQSHPLAGKTYKATGPNGGTVAFTLSHRYVESLDGLGLFFVASDMRT